MNKLTATILVFLVLCPFVIAIWWLFWKLWLWVIPQIWDDAPEKIAHPSFWLFVGIIFLISFIGKLLKGK